MEYHLYVAFYSSFIVSQKGCDYVMANHPEKAVDFNHQSHLTKYFPENGMAKDDCEVCHGYYENGRFKGLPTVGDCTSCHDPNGFDQRMPARVRPPETDAG